MLKIDNSVFGVIQIDVTSCGGERVIITTRAGHCPVSGIDQNVHISININTSQPRQTGHRADGNVGRRELLRLASHLLSPEMINLLRYCKWGSIYNRISSTVHPQFYEIQR